MTNPVRHATRRAAALLILLLVLAGCAEEDDRSFAPEAGTETAVSELTPFPTETLPPLQQQPGERASNGRSFGDLVSARGGVQDVGLREGGLLTVFTGDEAAARTVQLPEPETIVATSISANGETALLLRRSGDLLELEQIDLTNGAVSREIILSGTTGTPGASPVATPVDEQDGELAWRDRIEPAPDGARALVTTADEDVFLVTIGDTLEVQPVSGLTGTVTVIGWSNDGSTMLIGTHDAGAAAARIYAGAPGEVPREVATFDDRDERYPVQVAAPAQPSVLYVVLRSVDEDWSAQNNLYSVPLNGEQPRVVLGSGLAGPAGAVDRIAVTDDGETLAATVLVPRGQSLVYNSLWLADLASPSPNPVEVDTDALGRVSRLAWTEQGLLIVGAQRERSDVATRLVTVSALVSQDGTLQLLDRIASPATPLATPVDGAPDAATPEIASPIAEDEFTPEEPSPTPTPRG